MHVLLNRNQKKTELHSVFWSLLIFNDQCAVVQTRMACLQATGVVNSLYVKLLANYKIVHGINGSESISIKWQVLHSCVFRNKIFLFVLCFQKME